MTVLGPPSEGEVILALNKKGMTCTRVCTLIVLGPPSEGEILAQDTCTRVCTLIGVKPANPPVCYLPNYRHDSCGCNFGVSP